MLFGWWAWCTHEDFDRKEDFDSGCPSDHQYFSRGWGGSLPCVCNDALDYLNCNGEPRESIALVLTGDVHGSVGHIAALEELIDKYEVGGLALLDAGDSFFGSRFTSQRGPAGVAELMNKLKYSAMALGNHDIESEVDMNAFLGIANFPILCINPPTFLKEKTKTSLVLTIRGQKIGIVGYTVSTSVDSVISSLRAEAMRLRLKENVSCVVVLGHGGVEVDGPISVLLRGLVDIVLGGHSHILSPRNGSVLGIGQILHSGAAGSHVGIAKLRFVGQLLQDVTTQVETLKQQGTGTKYRNYSVSRWIQDSRWWEEEEHARKQSRVVKTVFLGSENEISRAEDCRHSRCALAEMVAQGMRSHFMCGTESISGEQWVVALREAGSVRGKISNGQNLTCYDIIDICPWANRLVAMKATVHALRLMLQYGIESSQDNKHGGAFLHASGLAYELSQSNPARVGRIFFAPRDQCPWKNDSNINVTASTVIVSSKPQGYQELGPDDAVVVVVTEWLANGGDGFGKVLEEGCAQSIDDPHPMAGNWTEVEVLCHELLGENLHLSVSTGILQTGGAAFVHGLGAALGSMFAMLLTYGCLTKHVQEITNSHTRSFQLGSLTSDKVLLFGATEYQNYKGLVLALTGVGMSSGIYWISFTMLMPGGVKQVYDDALTLSIVSLAAGVVNVVLTNPLWTVITRVQAGISVDTSSAALDLWKEGGLISFFKGLVPNLVMISYPAVQNTFFYLMDSIIRKQCSLLQTELSKTSLPLLLGMLSSVFATLITFPIQIWRIRNQAELSGRIGSCSLKEMCTPSGGLLQCPGILPKLAHTVVSGGTMFLFKEQFLELYGMK